MRVLFLGLRLRKCLYDFVNWPLTADPFCGVCSFPLSVGRPSPAVLVVTVECAYESRYTEGWDNLSSYTAVRVSSIVSKCVCISCTHPMP